MQKQRLVLVFYDIGLNLFCKQFPDPEKIIEDAEKSNVVCILTGTDRRENEKIDTFTRTHHAYGTVGIHPHNADSAKQEDFLRMEELAAGNEKIVAIGECIILDFHYFTPFSPIYKKQIYFHS